MSLGRVEISETVELESNCNCQLGHVLRPLVPSRAFHLESDGRSQKCIRQDVHTNIKGGGARQARRESIDLVNERSPDLIMTRLHHT